MMAHPLPDGSVRSRALHDFQCAPHDFFRDTCYARFHSVVGTHNTFLDLPLGMREIAEAHRNHKDRLEGKISLGQLVLTSRL